MQLAEKVVFLITIPYVGDQWALILGVLQELMFFYQSGFALKPF